MGKEVGLELYFFFFLSAEGLNSCKQIVLSEFLWFGCLKNNLTELSKSCSSLFELKILIILLVYVM